MVFLEYREPETEAQRHVLRELRKMYQWHREQSSAGGAGTQASGSRGAGVWMTMIAEPLGAKGSPPQATHGADRATSPLNQ